MGEFDQWLDEATPDEREVVVCFDRALLSRLDKARRELEELKAEGQGALGNAHPDKQAEVDQIEAAVAAKQRPLVFTGLGWGAWRDLLAKHPPKAEQGEVFAQAVKLLFMPHSIVNLGYHAETFVPAAISASCSSPGITVPQAQTMLRKAPPGVLDRIWNAVLEVNLGGNDDPFVRSPNGSEPQTAIAKR